MNERTWTPLDEIKRVAIDYMNGEHEEFDVEVIVVNSDNQPLWITTRSVSGIEVIIPWTAVRCMTVLEHKDG
jgi:hypothetical protein